MLELKKSLYISRLQNTLSLLQKEFFYREECDFALFFYFVGLGGMSLEEVQGQKFEEIQREVVWGQCWEKAWFLLELEIPQGWEEEKLVAYLNMGGEALVHRYDGEIISAISNGAVWEVNYQKPHVFVEPQHIQGGKLRYWVEATANGMFGLEKEADPKKGRPFYHGKHIASVQWAKLCKFDELAWRYHLSLDFARGMLRELEEGSVRSMRVLQAVHESLSTFCGQREKIPEALEILNRTLQNGNAPSDLQAYAVGHAHIDTAWLWPLRETIRKCARTFSNQISLLEEYPEYIFGASQPQLYEYTKEHYPALYEKIKHYVRQGRWELQGGMWVEPDANVPSGESLLRQLYYGKKFFLDEFGVEVDNLWLPDVFGYCASLPQFLKHAGVKYFLTQKISWNQFNKFPYHSFVWYGLDGSQVLTHFPPEDTYNSALSSEGLIRSQRNFKEKHILDNFMTLFGIGNGGGGPKEEFVQRGLMAKGVESVPRVKMARAADFFAQLEQDREKLPEWHGELYLELHRGTLTSQAKVKWSNRKLEFQLRLLELMYGIHLLEAYPAEELERLWKCVLRNQFHDILPGSSIHEVYVDTHAEYEEAYAACMKLHEQLAKTGDKGSAAQLTVFNSWNFKAKSLLELPQAWSGFEVSVAGGESLACAQSGDRYFCELSLEGLGSAVLLRGDRLAAKPAAQSNVDTCTLENQFLRYEFSPSGQLLRVWDKELQREFLLSEQQGNLLTIYEDRPADWDAWDIDEYYMDVELYKLSAESYQYEENELFSSLTFSYAISASSSMRQQILLPKGARRLDFISKVDWHEKHKMLRVGFHFDVPAAKALFDIQYSFLERNMHRNNSWDMAQFEVCAHKYVDFSNNSYGIALLNDCKYGHRTEAGFVELNLLRSPSNPDPDCDEGQHEFTYSLLPHANDLVNSQVQEEARMLNQGFALLAGGHQLQAPFSIEGNTQNAVLLEAVKKHGENTDLVLRLVENKSMDCQIKLKAPGYEIVEADLLERPLGAGARDQVSLRFRPFELKTVILHK